MKSILVLTKTGSFFGYDEMHPSDVWRMHRKGQLPEFLATTWIRKGRSNPIMAKFVWLYYQAVCLSLFATVATGSALGVFTPFEVFKFIGIPCLLIVFVVIFCITASRRVGIARSCSDVYAEHVCWLFNSLAKSRAKEGLAVCIPSGIDHQGFKQFVENWLVALQVRVHRGQKEEKKWVDWSDGAKIKLLENVARLRLEFQGIAQAGQEFGLVELDLDKYHKLADEEIERQDKEVGASEAAGAHLPALAKELIRKALTPKS